MWPSHVPHPFSANGRSSPASGYAWLREHDPVRFEPTARLWMISTYADCRTILRDDRFSARLGQAERARDDDLPVSMLTTDGAEHARLRAPGQVLLGPSAARELTQELRKPLDDLLDAAHERIAASAPHPVDLVDAVGRPFSIAVFRVLLGLTETASVRFAELAARASGNLDPLATAATVAQSTVASRELLAMLREHVRDNRISGTDSPVGRLLADTRLDEPETMGVLMLAVIGGFEPLAAFPGNAATTLLSRDLWHTTAHDDEADLVDELLRLDPPIPFTARVCTADVELSGRVVPAGARVLALLGAANRDAAVFSFPDRLDPTRAARGHLALGAGPHFCLGAALVRSAGALVLAGLRERLPDLSPAGSPVWGTSLVPRAVSSLPVARRS